MITVKEEISAIARKYNLGQKDLITHCRVKNVVRARNEAIFYIRINYGLSLERIGYIFNMHHSSISHAISSHVHSD